MQHVAFKLQYADPHEMAMMLDKVFQSTKTYADARTNTVIYAGPVSTLEDAQRLVEELDRPADEGAASDTIMIPVSRRPVELAEIIRRIVASRRFRIAADEGQSTLILAGSGPELAAARRIISQLDTVASSAYLEFAFFHAHQGVEQDELDVEIPADLAEVAREMQRFGAVELLGRLSAVTAEHQEFKIEGSIAEGVLASVEGVFLHFSANSSVKVQLKAFLRLEKSRPAEEGDKARRRGPSPTSKLDEETFAEFLKQQRSPQGPSPTFELETVVQTQRGNYVVLGSAPTGWSAGESVLLVLYVRP